MNILIGDMEIDKLSRLSYCLKLSSILYVIFFQLLLASAQYRDADIDSLYTREHSLVKPYQGSGMTIPNWEFFGSTIVTNNFIRLTPDTQSRQGGIWNTRPYRSKSWRVEVTFKVHGQGSDLYGDGFAIWYVAEPPRGGPIFGNRDYFKGLAVIMDTYANQHGVHAHAHPYISVMVNNGTLHYDQGSDGVNSELSGCECKFRGLENDARIQIQYSNGELLIQTDIDDTGSWRDCVRINGVYLPANYFFGITAATGDLSDNHDILAIKMMHLSDELGAHENRPDDLPRADYGIPHQDRNHESSSSGIRKFFLIFFVFAGVIAVAGFGYFLYQSKTANSRKRFY